MLKIKDNVDLKELEKFGFMCGMSGWEWINREYSRTHIYIDEFRNIFVADIGRTTHWACIPNVIFDLIQAGLVEKVD